MIKYKFEKNDYDPEPHFKGLKNVCIKADWDESDEEPSTSTSVARKRQMLHSSGASRRFGQQLYPMFMKDERATTANVDVIRRRHQKMLSASFIRQKQDMKPNQNLSDLGIKSQEYKLTSFKQNIDQLHR